ncbi:MAG TPA: DUF1573 domain-containing protein [Lacibacter sp.]|nr:DUF1573 domain-containing protein [Lacibacter sp.]HMO89175.1 DUF1573 domain-containing protein [Lacibacter sp.]HMP87421.1 DUF1573 domain-containing protein [Lacibacter sp.]
MKYLFAFIFAAFLLACGNNVDKSVGEQQIQSVINDTLNWTTVQWTDSVQNFGKVTDGEKVMISFHVRNTGSKPLVISSVNASCGCTVPEKPEAPIAPGEEGVIKAEFNSAGRVGIASKYVNVVCNTAQQNYTLLFEGEVLPKK